MIVLALTGSIGMGKSTTAKMFEAAGVPIYDADAEVHKLYAKGGAAVAAVEAAFPGVVKDGAVDRGELSKRVLDDIPAILRLEAIVHPMVSQSRVEFFKRVKAEQADVVVLDIPLLFETGGERNVDAVVVASAPAELQRERVLARPGMSEAKFASILQKQTPDAEKRARADFIVDTSRGLDAARDQVLQILQTIRAPGWTPRPRAPLEGAAERGH
jgi:dephospho-CoA kinase